jgi:hypothetical protein
MDFPFPFSTAARWLASSNSEAGQNTPCALPTSRIPLAPPPAAPTAAPARALRWPPPATRLPAPGERGGGAGGAVEGTFALVGSRRSTTTRPRSTGEVSPRCTLDPGYPAEHKGGGEEGGLKGGGGEVEGGGEHVRPARCARPPHHPSRLHRHQQASSRPKTPQIRPGSSLYLGPWEWEAGQVWEAGEALRRPPPATGGWGGGGGGRGARAARPPRPPPPITQREQSARPPGAPWGASGPSPTPRALAIARCPHTPAPAPAPQPPAPAPAPAPGPLAPAPGPLAPAAGP